MLSVQTRSIAQTVTLFGGTFLLGRMIERLPGTTQGGLFLSAGVGTLSLFATQEQIPNHTLRTVISLTLGIFTSVAISKAFKQKTYITAKGALCFLIPQTLIAAFLSLPAPATKGSSSKTSSSTTTEDASPLAAIKKAIEALDDQPLPSQIPGIIGDYLSIHVNEIFSVPDKGTLYLGSYPAAESLVKDYEPKTDWSGKIPTTAHNLDIQGVVTVGFSGQSPAKFLSDDMRICTTVFSEESTEKFLENFKEQFETIFAGVKEKLDKGENVLVHCSQGEHRSAIVVAALMMRLFDVTKGQAINWVRSKRPIILPDTGNKFANANVSLDWVHANKESFKGYFDK